MGLSPIDSDGARYGTPHEPTDFGPGRGRHRPQFMKTGLQSALMSGLFRGLAALPYAWVARLGEGLGALLYRIPGQRKRILHTNLRLCFPDHTPAQREQLARSSFQHVIRSYLERGLQWFGSAQAISKMMQIDSAIELKDHYEQPTLFLGFHFAGIEAGCMYYSARYPVASIYTPMSDQAADTLAKTQRSRFGSQMIPRHGSARDILKILKSGTPVMLAADMDFGLRDSVFVPFFGIQTCTLTSVSRLAQLGRARVVPFVTEVLDNYRGYKLKIYPPLPDFPSGDLQADALAMNQFLEARILEMPEQYYWVHRRFKRRPPGEAPVY